LLEWLRKANVNQLQVLLKYVGLSIMKNEKEMMCQNCGCRMIDNSFYEPGGFGIKWHPIQIYEKKIAVKRAWICQYCDHEVPFTKAKIQFTHDLEKERAEILLKSGDWLEADHGFTQVILNYPWSANAWIGKGISAIAMGIELSDVGKDKYALQYFKMAAIYLSKPVETPYDEWVYSNKYKTKVGLAEPSNYEFYKYLIENLKLKTVSDELIYPLAKIILTKLIVPSHCRYDQHGRLMLEKILRMGKLYYSIIKWIKPNIGDDQEYSYVNEEALMQLRIVEEKYQKLCELINSDSLAG